MRICTLEEVARFSGGRLINGNPLMPVNRLHTDTRTLAVGDCFVALQGDRFDGHAFVPQARESRRGRGADFASHRFLRSAFRPRPGRSARIRSRRCSSFAANYRQLLSGENDWRDRQQRQDEHEGIDRGGLARAFQDEGDRGESQ